MAVVSFIATGTFVSGMACIAVGLFLTLRQAGDHPSTTAASEGALLPRIIEAMSRFADSLSKYPAGMQLVFIGALDRKSTRLNSSHIQKSRMPSSA